ncbi:hypothetical protein ACFOW4_13775 [Micromonospora sp. GCM10011542]|uniref:hypothetical protein n=1 Tax=Micromonospora sp. GCM10011542 TaxID=3317337 RepID=UPI003620CCD8
MTPQSTDTAVPMMKKWLRGGLITLAALQTVASVWQYVFPRSFYDDFPTVRLDPAYNEHLVSDVGGLGLALTAMSRGRCLRLSVRREADVTKRGRSARR